MNRVRGIIRVVATSGNFLTALVEDGNRVVSQGTREKKKLMFIERTPGPVCTSLRN